MNGPSGYVIANLSRRLLVEEDLRLMPYHCTEGKLSIGVGRNLEDRGISRDEAEFMLINDLTDTFNDLDRALPWWRLMYEARQIVIADMCFNMGLTKLLRFTKTLAAMKAGRYEEASREMLDSVWARQVGDRANRLASIMKTGVL